MWTERVYLAALDAHDLRLAEECLSRMKTKFPSSSRVRMLEARLLEAQEQYEDASKIYDEILKEDPSDAVSTNLVSTYVCMYVCVCLCVY